MDCKCKMSINDQIKIIKSDIGFMIEKRNEFIINIYNYIDDLNIDVTDRDKWNETVTEIYYKYNKLVSYIKIIEEYINNNSYIDKHFDINAFLNEKQSEMKSKELELLAKSKTKICELNARRFNEICKNYPGIVVEKVTPFENLQDYYEVDKSFYIKLINTKTNKSILMNLAGFKTKKLILGHDTLEYIGYEHFFNEKNECLGTEKNKNSISEKVSNEHSNSYEPDRGEKITREELQRKCPNFPNLYDDLFSLLEKDSHYDDSR